MTRAKIGAILIFLKEAAHAIDAARQITERTPDRRTTASINAVLRDLVNEINRLELLRHTGS